MQGRQPSYMVMHSDLFVRSIDASLDFYCTKLGFSLVDDALIHGPLVAEISGGLYNSMRLVLIRVSRIGAMIELQEFQPGSALREDAPAQTTQTGLVTFLVSDLEDHIERMKRKDLHPASPVFEVSLPQQGDCRVVFYRDPDGNRLEFLQVTKPAARPLRAT